MTDRSPGEFYQLDMEMAFVEQDDVFNAIEPFYTLYLQLFLILTLQKHLFQELHMPML